ncbi:hypothetical protein OAP18_01230 [Gammaproteobacteria bacterium]|nr:hypothetical protein [Gammaproteobacteria bacterium]
MLKKSLFGCLLFLSSPLLAQADLTGTWDNGSGIDFIRPTAIGNSVCVVACPELADASAPAPARPRAVPSRPVYKAEFLARVADLHDRQVEEDPVLRCTPPGVPRIGPPDKIVQTEKEVIFLYDDVSGNFFRIIPVDGRGHRSDVERSFLGDAIGHWEGDILVVETLNFNTDTWLTDDGSFHTENLRVLERVSRNGDELTWDAIAYDPEVLAEPWDLPVRTAILTESEIHEAALCIERDLEHIVDGTHHDNAR